MELRDYQKDLRDDIFKSLRGGHKGIVVCAQTGAGKMALLTWLATNSNQRVLILFHVKRLVNQCCGWLDNWGCKDYTTDIKGMSRVKVVMMQSYGRNKDKIAHDYNRIIIDEGHHIKAKTYQNIFDLMPDAVKLAFTATPVRLDGSGLIDYKHFTDIVVSVSAQNLVDRGFLSEIKLMTQPIKIDYSSLKSKAGDYDDESVYQALKGDNMGKIMGDACKYYREYVDGKPALSVCSTVEHSEQVAQMFNDGGISAVSVSGNTKKNDMDRILRDYKCGKIKMICYCQIFGEGVDLPDACAIFYMRLSKSLTVWRQNCGRVARKPYADKVSYVFDHVGQCHQDFLGEPMGHPYRDIDWMEVAFRQQENKSKKGKSKKVYERCDKCLFIYDANEKECPNCGHDSVTDRAKKKELEIIAGELKEQSEIDRVAQKSLSELRTLKDLQRYAKVNGYKKGWAWYEFKRRFKNRDTQSV